MKKKDYTTPILIVVLVVGLSLLLYPSISNYWNSFHQSRAITSYSEEVASLNDEEYDQILQLAQQYNEELANRDNQYALTERQREQYWSLLNLSGTGVMGYVEIPAIECELPIYHGTNESVLQVAIGHLDWTSLPVGGETSHCVISGHRGLPSAKLFTDLDKLVEGDIFNLHILDEVFTYEVDKITIVEPDETEELQIETGRDLCTMMTCTPYGINSHRLFVTGHRTDNVFQTDNIRVTADAVQIEPLIIAPMLALPILIILIIILLIPRRKDRESNQEI